jgi:hypothetical protein
MMKFTAYALGFRLGRNQVEFDLRNLEADRLFKIAFYHGYQNGLKASTNLA